MSRFLLAIALVSCGLPHADVLSSTSPPNFEDCATALQKAKLGDSCSNLRVPLCTLDEPPCCKTSLRCNGSTVTSLDRDCTACPACTTDKECAALSICIDQHCEPCGNKLCPPCVQPFVKLTRNGCDSCDCGPPNSPCAGCGTGEICAVGAFCQPACIGPDCCASFCAAPGCAAPDPEGCALDCGTSSCGGICRASGCKCNAGKWSCVAVCALELKAYVGRCGP